MSGTPLRFLLAMVLMLGVLVGTNLLFPPIVPEPVVPADTAPPAAPPTIGPSPGSTAVVPNAPGTPPPVVTGAPDAPIEEIVRVESPLYQLEFSSFGARLLSAELPQFAALNREGVVDLVPVGAGDYLSQKLVVGADTVDLSRAPYEVQPVEGITLVDGGAPQSLRFVYQHPTASLRVETTYTFDPSLYVVSVAGRVDGVDRPLMLTDLGEGLAFTEADSVREARMMAYVYNHLDEGISSVPLTRASPGIVQGPLIWAAFKNKFFVLAMLSGSSDETTTGADYIGGLMLNPGRLPGRVHAAAAQGIGTDGSFEYRLVLGPQDHASLASLGQGLDEVNPYGGFLRPIVRPFVGIIFAILAFLHDNLGIGYGWVLILFGLIMRVVLFPLNHKAMKAQVRNMEFQPRMAEAQRKYKDNPQKMQEEVRKLYKEGFNPLAGCLPMLLPLPILFALFFVFQNTIELRGEAFLWLPDLSTKDPLYILPMMLALSMFLMQWLTQKSVDQTNEQTQMQMKMMMWILPPFMLLLFVNFASGLNLYYVVSNLATIPQQMWFTKQRQKLRAQAGARAPAQATTKTKG
jgi:YidC/Oxa1 family membrane protein insertase